MSPSRDARRAQLKTLARLHGVQTSYVDASGRRITPPLSSVEATLACMGADVARPGQAIRSRQSELRRRVLGPVVVAWDRRGRAELRLGKRPPASVSLAIELEDGETIEASHRTEELKAVDRAGPDGEPETLTHLPLPGSIPAGYHRLTVTVGKMAHAALLISAPKRSYRQPPEMCDREWGLFCPMYALHSERSLGSGDLTDLRTLARWQAALGARVVGSLPMLAVYLDEPFDPSPYAPVSRMFWNELFVDPKATPEFAGSAEARRRAESKPFVQEADSLSAAALVQYRRQAALRRQLLEPCAERFFERGGQDTQPYRAFLASNPDLPSYARFRAVMERQKVGWAEWSARLREGQIRTNDFDPAHERYHLYAQFCFDRQFSALKTDLSGHDALVYLDLPVGVRRDGYDVWRDPGLFADGAKVGAPADPYFSSGQDWGFPPMLPEASGEQGHESFARSVRAHMRHADFLRLDHVMAFHRLYWIPPTAEATEGLYVTYPHEELYAILCLESHRNRCQLVGENLGTVPPGVNRELEKRGISALYVTEYEVRPDPDEALRPVPATSVASINTHDMAPLARFWDGSDIDDRVGIGVLGRDLAERDRASRAEAIDALATFLGDRENAPVQTLPAARDALHRFLGDSDAEFVLVNIEDLWLEGHWQNIPGTSDEYPNWRHKLRYSLERIVEDEELARRLKAIDHARRTRRGARTPH
jgi:4-alpha-glucanotransferase